MFVVEGIRHIGEAADAGAILEAIFFAPDLLQSEFAKQLIEAQMQAGISCIPVSSEVFGSLADKENPQGILAIVRQPDSSLEDLTPDTFPWGVALVSPQDPGNLGAVLRSVDAVGASGLIILESSVDIFHPSAIRAGMGTIFWHPVVCTSFDEFASWSTRHSYHLYGTSAHGAVDYQRIENYIKPRVLLLGSERQGLLKEQSAICEVNIRLPMRGRVTSLNLAVAAGIILYAMLEKDLTVYRAS